MNQTIVFTGAEIFDGHKRHMDCALVITDGKVVDICSTKDLPTGGAEIVFDGGLIAPGLVDLQVNGGGGVMLNNAPDVATLRTVCAAHMRVGSTTIMPTLITDTEEQTKRAIVAAKQAATENVSGMCGLHLEGPHLCKTRKGAHDPDLICKMTSSDLQRLLEANSHLPSMMITVAPEAVTDAQIKTLSDAGIVVSIGHSDASFTAAQSAAQSGASCVTHLFNAMSQLKGRDPGVVGAALQNGALYAGLIADGIHVDAASIQIALRAKQGPAKMFLASDAMATIGSEIQNFHLNGRKILRHDGRLTLENGTLAGADIDLISAVRYVANTLGLPLEEALRMASLYPAQLLKKTSEYGSLLTGSRADFIHLDQETVSITGVWKGGNKIPTPNGQRK